jgi:hypothetical protein
LIKFLRASVKSLKKYLTNSILSEIEASLKYTVGFHSICFILTVQFIESSLSHKFRTIKSQKCEIAKSGL